jgi:hypothetical protein
VAPEGFELSAGSLVDRNGTLLEVKPDPIAKFSLPSPTTRGNNVAGVGLMVPLRFGPFNPNHTVGVWQTAGWCKGLYAETVAGAGNDRWSTLGLDDDGLYEGCLSFYTAISGSIWILRIHENVCGVVTARPSYQASPTCPSTRRARTAPSRRSAARCP